MLLLIVFAARKYDPLRGIQSGSWICAGGGPRGGRVPGAGFLFDVTSFPHVPYILFSLAALAAVIVAGDDPALAGPAVVRRHRRRPGARPPRDPHLPRREPVPAGRRGGSSPRTPAFD